jgi:hypothetical protein
VGLALFWEIHLNIHLEKCQSNIGGIITKYQTVNQIKGMVAEEIKNTAA